MKNKKFAVVLISVCVVAVVLAALWLIGIFGSHAETSSDTSSPAEQSSQPAEQPSDERTVLVYMCGSNLETNFGAATKNIAEMLTAELPDGVNLVLETGGARKWRNYDISGDCLSRYIVKNGELELLQTVPQDNMGYKETLSDFLEYGTTNFPAKNTAVILWDHGGGCINGMISDENYGSGSISIEDLRLALTAVKEQSGCHIDLLGMDACLMGNFETAYAVKDCCDYMVASEEIEPTAGWDYGALVTALARDKTLSGEALGKAICDGFGKKYGQPEQSPSTLSVIDLSKIDAVSDALDASIKKISESGVDLTSIRNIADSAFHSVRCGANSKRGGYSNLIDLGDFAEYYGNLTNEKELCDALDGCVTYVVNNNMLADYGGISFYYPINYTDNGFANYYDNICPLASYKDYLKQMFLNMPETTIKAEKAEVTENGAFSVTITEDSLPYVLNKEYTLAEIIGGEGSTAMRILGTDNDVERTEDGRTFISNFRGVWPALNGCIMNIIPVGKTDKANIYEAPVRVNGEDCLLRFSFVFDETMFNNGYYQVLGVWNGIEEEIGMADKGLKPLEPDDVVEVYSVFFDFMSETFLSLQLVSVPKSEDGYQITEEPLQQKTYLYSYSLKDIYGNSIDDLPSAMMEMTKTPEELKEHPLPDGTYAAEVVSIE